jgi:hypothetical protein
LSRRLRRGRSPRHLLPRASATFGAHAVLPFLHGQTHLLRHNVRRMSKRNKDDACDDDGTGISGGTPMFMAPEVTQGAAADVWALRCTVVAAAIRRPDGRGGGVSQGTPRRGGSRSSCSVEQLQRRLRPRLRRLRGGGRPNPGDNR